MIKGILGIFDKDAQAAKRSLRDYATCEDFARKIKRRFREGVVKELLFAHDDAVFLISDVASKGIAYSKKSDVFYYFSFGDELVPTVDFVPHDGDTASREVAIKKFEHWIEGGYPYANYQRDQIRRNPSSRIHLLSLSTAWAERGYKIGEAIAGDRAFGVKLELNGKSLARLSTWEPQPNGYLARTLSQGVMSEPVGLNDGINSLDFSIFYDGYTYVGNLACSLFYDGRASFKGEAGLARLHKEFSGVSAFLTAIEPTIKQPSSEWDMETEEDLAFARQTYSFD